MHEALLLGAVAATESKLGGSRTQWQCTNEWSDMPVVATRHSRNPIAQSAGCLHNSVTRDELELSALMQGQWYSFDNDTESTCGPLTCLQL